MRYLYGHNMNFHRHENIKSRIRWSRNYRLLWNPKVNYRVHMKPSSILNQSTNYEAPHYTIVTILLLLLFRDKMEGRQGKKDEKVSDLDTL